jgi:HEAT repeat protein
MTPQAPAAVGLMIETFRHLRDVYGYSPDGDAAERVALTEGLLAGLERTADPRARGLLLEVLESDSESVAARSLAVRGLGAIACSLVRADPADEVGELRRVLREQLRALEPLYRHAAARGLGRIPTFGALQDLETALSTEEDPEVRATLLTSIGTLATPWAWVSHGPALADRAPALRQAAARYVTERLVAGDEAARDAVLLAAHPISLELLDPHAHADLVETLRRKLR